MFTLNRTLNLLLICFFTLTIQASDNINNLLVPDGFEISIFASELQSPRQITETSDGHIIVGSKKGSEVIALIDKNNDGRFIKLVIANGLQNPAGVAYYKGDLYFAEMDTIWKINQIDSWLKSDHKKLPEKKYS